MGLYIEDPNFEAKQKKITTAALIGVGSLGALAIGVLLWKRQQTKSAAEAETKSPSDTEIVAVFKDKNGLAWTLTVRTTEDGAEGVAKYTGPANEIYGKVPAITAVGDTIAIVRARLLTKRDAWVAARETAAATNIFGS